MARRRGRSMGDSRLEVTAGRPVERLLLDAAADVQGGLILCLMSPEGAAAQTLAEMRPEATVCCHVLDLGLAEYLTSSYGVLLPNLEVACQPDVPVRPFDLATLAFPSWGETELARELLEQGADVLRSGGTLLATADPAGDSRLHDELKRHFAKVTRLPQDDGVVFLAHKESPLRKRRDFRHEFAFRDGERLIRAVSRPGLHSHRRMEGGLRPALDVLDVGAGERVLNLGCDAGVIAMAAAAREPTAHIHAVDFNPRSIECVVRGAAMNELTNIATQLIAGRWKGPAGSIDLAIASPPYIPQERLREIFIDGIVAALKPGGRVRIVSKHSAWFAEEFGRVLTDVAVTPVRDHMQIFGRKRG